MTFINRTAESYRVKDINIFLVEVYDAKRYFDQNTYPCDLSFEIYRDGESAIIGGMSTIPVALATRHSPRSITIDGVASSPRSFEIAPLRTTGATALFNAKPTDWKKTKMLLVCSVVRYFGNDGSELRVNNITMALAIDPVTYAFSLQKSYGPFVLWPFQDARLHR